jgi:type IV secretion system protein TrbE
LIRLAQFRDRATGFPDLLNFAALVDDGVHIGKDGALTAAWRFRGPDTGHATFEEMASISRRLNDALLRLGSGWMLHVDAMRRNSVEYPELGAFPDVTSQVIDQERRQCYLDEGRHLETTYVLALTFLPPSNLENRIFSFFGTRSKKSGQSSSGPASWALEAFKRQIEEVEPLIKAVLPLERLKAARAGIDHRDRPIVFDELLAYFESTVSGEFRHVRLPAIPMYLDALIGNHAFVAGMTPKVGRRHLRVLAVDGFPQESFPGILDALGNLACEFRWNTRFIVLDAPEARKLVESHRRRWRQKIRGLREQVFQTAGGVVNLDAQAMANDSEAAIGEAESRLVGFGLLSTVLVFFDEDEERVEANVTEARKLLAALGFGARVEDINAVEAFLGSLPGHGWQNQRRVVVHTLNLADLLPITSIYAGPETNPCDLYPAHSPPLCYAETAGSTPFRLSLHVSDVGHSLIAGPTGAGKSTLVCLLAAQHRRYAGARVIAFDKGNSLEVLCRAVGGVHAELEIGGHFSFAPLARVSDPDERAWLAEWLEGLLLLQGLQISPEQRRTVFETLTRLGEKNRVPRMTEFAAELGDPALRDTLQHYTYGGPCGALFEAEADTVGIGDFVVFELDHLMSAGEKNLLPVLLYLFHQIERSLDGRPTLLILEECWLMLGHRLFSAQLREWLKTLRKKNVAVVMATQDLSDLLDSSIRATIISNCPTRILLPNLQARSDVFAKLYKELGLNSRELDLLAQAVAKSDYYVQTPYGRRLLSFGLGPVALAFCAVSDPETLKRVRRLIELYPQDWQARWLEERGVSDWARYWRQVASAPTGSISA